jgi:hypothetical protein
MDICGLPCPAKHPDPPAGFAIGVGIIVLIFCAIGLAAFYFVGGKAENFFVAGRSLPSTPTRFSATPTSRTSTTSTTAPCFPSASVYRSSSTACSSRTT